MANPIPPLLCSTPPPIDFDEESGTNNDTNDDFCEFDTGDTETFDGQSLPSTPRHLIHATNIKSNLSFPAKDENTTDVIYNKENVNVDEKKESKEFDIKPSNEVKVEVIEKDLSENEYLNDFEINPKCEKSTSNLENSVLDSDERYTSKNNGSEEVLFSEPVSTEVNNKNDELINDETKETLFVEYEDETLENIEHFERSHIQVNEESPSSEIVSSSNEIIDNINESQINNISNDKNINLKKSSICESEHVEVCVQNIESKLPEILNVECSFTFEADFSQFQAFDSFETTSINQIHEPSKFNNSSAIKNAVELEITENEYSKESFNNDEDDFDNFQNYSSEIVNDPDTDDSNEFTDFKEAAPPPISEISTTNTFLIHSNLKQNIKIILDTIFPVNENDNNMDLNIQKDFKTKLILNSVDSATALNFQWSNSTIKQSLVKSIGIDSRNILHGEKWNSSMPRFAANLGFNPLEPLKPIKLDSTINNSNYLESESSTSFGKTVANRIDVPAVEFDWNTSGLVNPLDGGKEIIHERKIETLHTTESGQFQDTCQPLSKTEKTIDDVNCSGSSNSNNTKSIVTIEEDREPIHTKEHLSTFDTNLIIEQISGPTIIKTNNIENMKNSEQLKYNNYQSSENIDVTLTSSSSNANTFIVPLKETHIFTPSKSDAAVSRSTTNITETQSNGKCTTIDFDYEIAAAGTVIDETVIKKEYRDIEYNPNKFIVNNVNTNSTQINETQNPVNGENSEIREGDHEIELNIANGSWDFCNNTLKTETNDTYVLDNTLQKNIDTNLRKELSIDTDESLSQIQDGPTIERFNNFLKPTIGLSPTENSIKTNEFQIENKKVDNLKMNSFVDDEFTDFQFVPPSSTTIPTTSNPLQSISSHRITTKDTEKSQRTNTLDQMILSPAILLPQTVQLNCDPKINWPEPGIDPQELARIETLFPSVKQNSFHNQSTNSMSHTSNTSNENTCASTVNNDDDWSDFISVPAANIVENNLNTIYCPKSPTKVAKSMTTTTTNDHTNDDEWSDFISSTSSTNTMNSEVFHKSDNVFVKNNYLHTNTNTSQQNYKNVIPNQLDKNMINNKFSKYLLNNGNFDSKCSMHLNSMKTNDFIPQNNYQHQQINQQNIIRNPLNHHKVTPNISLIPDLGYAAPQNFISIPKTNLQKK